MHQHLLLAHSISAYVDRELSPSARLETARHLARSPGGSAQVVAYQDITEALHVLYDAVLGEPVPRRLSERLAALDGVNQAPRRKRPRSVTRHGRGLAAVAAAVPLFAAVGCGWYLRDLLSERALRAAAVDSFLSEAANAYAFHGKHDFARSIGEAGGRQALADWLSEAVGAKPKPPVLAGAGFKAVGGRILLTGGARAGQVIYHNSAGNRVAVYFQVLQNGDNSESKEGLIAANGSRYARRNDLSIYYWDAGPVAYALVGEQRNNALTRAAQMASARRVSP